MIIQYGKKDAGNLSANFRKAEFACKCSRCSTVTVDMELVDILQQIRDHFGKPVNINSGYRCEAHNAEVGGASGSHHTKGMAADIRVVGIAPREVAKYAESIGVKRIGLYEGDEGEFVHIGSGATKRFWLGHGIKIVDTFGGAKEQTDKPALKFKKGDIVRFGGGNHYASSNASSGPVVKESRAKITDVYEAGIHPYHCRAVNDAGAYIDGVYGWVNETDLSAPESTWTPKIGDVVVYNGATHYSNANAVSGSACKGGQAKITNIYQLGKSKHPYHLVRVNGKGASVYGWVDEGTFTKA